MPHRQAPLDMAATDQAWAVLEPERIPFISYPYEWSFGQLRDAALLTLRGPGTGARRGSDPAGRQRLQRPVPRRRARLLIDTLSFEPREGGAPWMAYRQFCEHFLAPLRS